MRASTQILIGDCQEQMKNIPDKSIYCCVTSPPYYGLRDYKIDGQVGLEKTPEKYIQKIVDVFSDVHRILRDDGTVWINLGDSYVSSGVKNGNVNNEASTLDGGKTTQAMAASVEGQFIYDRKPKDLLGIPWRVAFALQADGWYLRQDIIWHKPNPMPESVRDRCTKSHEYVFLLSKSPRYFYDSDAIKEESIDPESRIGRNKRYDDKFVGQKFSNTRGFSKIEVGTKYLTRNKRSVWTVSTQPFKGSHFAVYPPKLVEPMILAGCPDRCCPVCGAGWVRITKHHKGIHNPKASKDQKIRQDGVRTGGLHNTTIGSGQHGWDETLGFEPSCDCNSTDYIPGTVIDPFGGSGTTAYVANAYGRNAILCELNPEYENLIRERLKLPYDRNDNVDNNEGKRKLRRLL